VSAYPLMLDGAQLRALVVGGGAVALRKTRGLRAAGASVRVVAPALDDALAALAAGDAMVSAARRPYAPGDIADAALVVAATGDRAVNARVAADARAAGRLVNVVDAPAEGNCWTAAVHRAGDLVVAVTAGGVPAVAARVRDAIAARFDARYGRAASRLAALRTRLLADGRDAEWRTASSVVVGDDFCAAVESGAFDERVARWD